MNKNVERLYNGLIKENPTFVLMLGMGLSTTVVLVLSNMLISAFRKVIPDGVRMPAYIVIVASLVTVVQFIMQAYTPSLSESLGVYIPLIVVNCIILGRAESYASKNPVVPSLFDGLGMGLGFTMGLTLIGLFRELLGAGQIFGFQILSLSWFTPITIFVMAPGAFLVLACLVAVMKIVREKMAAKGKPLAEPSGCITGDCAGCGMSAACTGKKPAAEAPAVVFVITISSFVTALIYKYILANSYLMSKGIDLTYLQTIVFILVIAALVQFVEMFLKKSMPALYQSLGVYLPLITTNCAVLGVALTNVTKEYGILESVVNGFATAFGFLIAIVLMAGVREKIEYNDIPKPFQGTAIVLISACLMSIAFMGFSGMI